jgi:hypothetical protein
MTAEVGWNPCIFDNASDDVEAFYDATDDDIHHGSNQYGEYRYLAVAAHNGSCEPEFFETIEFFD